MGGGGSSFRIEADFRGPSLPQDKLKPKFIATFVCRLKPAPPKGISKSAQLKLAATFAARGRRGGHGNAVPLQAGDAAFGLGALKRRPYRMGRGTTWRRRGLWCRSRGWCTSCTGLAG